MKQDLGFYIRSMRISIGIIYIWFGALKFFPHLSPAEDLAQNTIQLLTQGLISGSLAVKALATMEVMIGLLMLFKIQIRLAIMAMLGHMLCTLTPALLLPELFFTHAPYGLTLVGQYIVKNAVFIFAAMLIHRYQQIQDTATVESNYSNVIQLNPAKKKIIMFGLLCFLTSEISAQSPWALKKGESSFSMGYSRKTAGKRWYPASIDTKGTPTNYSDDTWSADSLQEAGPLIDGKFHDFRYVYFEPTFGLGKGFEISALICYLDGYERTTTEPTHIPGKSIKLAQPKWEVNRGFTDSWLRLKYQLPVKIPMAIEINSRFPDLYDQPGKEYSRYNYQYIGKDTFVEASPEWRGLLKRDLAINYHIGGSFDRAGKSFFKGQLGYNWRQGAFADQLLASIAAGYNFRLKNDFGITPNFFIDYAGGMDNGGTPDLTDRFFFNGRKNFYFNNSKTLRLYLNLNVNVTKHLSISMGYGNWIWGRGTAKYQETFIQTSYRI